MEKRFSTFGFLITALLLLSFTNKHLDAQNEFTNYITISNGEFMDGNNVFKPLCINYVEDYACNISDSLIKKLIIIY